MNRFKALLECMEEEAETPDDGLERLKKQIQFVVEVDRLKGILRQNLVMDSSRQENSVEHSWHLAVMVLLLSEYAPAGHFDMMRVVKMVLIHDIVEIDAGDTFVYDVAGNEDKAEREIKAAERLFGMLPADQQDEFWALWREFEARKTPEARFAGALDRLQPLLCNFSTDGDAWRRHGVKRGQVIEKNHIIEEGAPLLWDYASCLINEAARRGMLERE